MNFYHILTVEWCQILKREARKLTAELSDWVAASQGNASGYSRILTVEEKAAIRRGQDRSAAESSGQHFPLHELVDRMLYLMMYHMPYGLLTFLACRLQESKHHQRDGKWG